jgi:hypothetical protein
MRQALREIASRLKQREPIIWVAGVVFLALVLSGWLVEALERLFAR